ncbi:hypothetical protein MmiHf6_07250 [Methanimicrococcus hongohii]|uniref:Peptidase S8/S53 domain-containing protein n=1 Tax=Methanimicrococcus hongohii TaxID=3028295 RepID=A0AA96V1P2_9EURY|nr:S8 family peptidase [Methanimicrococcus sp. Hf6]WNY23418.1 hypothetical protein MmiHf6_07250 [Methanimicrococcus sp. Hf6]
MSEKKLPIQLVLPRVSDITSNTGFPAPKFFGEFTPEIQQKIINDFDFVRDYYKDLFIENEHVPAVSKITIKSEAIAKSHKPADLCKKCPIIGSKNLNEIYIKVTKQSLDETIKIIEEASSVAIKANLTAIETIQPIQIEEKITSELLKKIEGGEFNEINDRIKIKFFNFDNEYDDQQILQYLMTKLDAIDSCEHYELITFKGLQYIKAKINNSEDIKNIASLNGVKTIDFFQNYSLPSDYSIISDNGFTSQKEYANCETCIGIIDGGISTGNELLRPYIADRMEYVSSEYQNPSHATFIASTIQFGNELNDIESNDWRHFSFIDVVALPNNDPTYGPTDGVGELELMEIIIEAMDKHSSNVKIWNLSLGFEDIICDGHMTDFGIFLDLIQDEYTVQFFVSSGNFKVGTRQWPPQEEIGELDRIISPADSVRAITVGSIALSDSDNSIVKCNEPSPFSRRGPGANFLIKPDVVDYGGNIGTNSSYEGLGLKGLDSAGHVIEGIGTSYSNPRVTQKFSSIYDEMVDKDILLAKAMIIHSAKIESREHFSSENDVNYYGFGKPATDVLDILQCSESEVTLVFRQEIKQRSHLEMWDFPYPPSLIRDGKYYGEICMTLVYNPPLNENYGNEYCRCNIDVGFGRYVLTENGARYKSEIPLDRTWSKATESEMVENGFKWSPVKSYYRNIKNGIEVRDGWKIRIDMTPRFNEIIPRQEFVLIVTIRDPEGRHDIYSEMIRGLKEKGFSTNNLEIKQQIRQRQ